MGINPKVNVIACLGFELVYFETADQHFSYYTPCKCVEQTLNFLSFLCLWSYFSFYFGVNDSN